MTTIAFMKRTKQPQVFQKASPETTAQKETNLVQNTQMNYVNRNLLLYYFIFPTLSNSIINIPRKAAIRKYEVHTQTMVEGS